VAVHPLPYSDFVIPASAAFPNGRVASRPFLRIALVNAGLRLSCYALVDSGADYCAFPRSFMQPVGLDALTSPIDQTTGVSTASVPTHFANVSIDLQGLVEFPVYAGFTVGLEQMGLGLLGQVGFFDRFNISFSKKVCYIEIPDPHP